MATPFGSEVNNSPIFDHFLQEKRLRKRTHFPNYLAQLGRTGSYHWPNQYFVDLPSQLEKPNHYWTTKPVRHCREKLVTYMWPTFSLHKQSFILVVYPCFWECCCHGVLLRGGCRRGVKAPSREGKFFWNRIQSKPFWRILSKLLRVEVGTRFLLCVLYKRTCNLNFLRMYTSSKVLR